MSYVPRTVLAPDYETISTWSYWGLGDLLRGLSQSLPGTAAWPSANLAIYVPVVIPRPVVVLKMGWINGVTASGNIDVGIYDVTGAKVVTAGSTAQGTTSVAQLVNTTDVQLVGPARYYLAMSMDNTTGTVGRNTLPVSGTAMRGIGCAQEASAFALPATATLAVMANNYVPFVFALVTTVM